MNKELLYWEKTDGSTGVEYLLYFEMFYDFELIAKITLDNGGYPCVTSYLLDTNEEPLYESLTIEKAKKDVERMVLDKYQSEAQYYEHLRKKFEEATHG